MITSFDELRLPVPEGVDPRRVVEEWRRAGRPVPLILNGPEAEVVFGQVDGHPALGWVRDVWELGTGLLVSFTDVPSAVRDRIAMGVRLAVKGEWDGDRLKAVSIAGLGLAPVDSLESFRAALMSDPAPGDAVHRLARTYSAEKCIAYGDAVRQVIQEHRALGQRYIRMPYREK